MLQNSWTWPLITAAMVMTVTMAVIVAITVAVSITVTAVLAESVRTDVAILMTKIVTITFITNKLSF